MSFNNFKFCCLQTKSGKSDLCYRYIYVNREDSLVKEIRDRDIIRKFESQIKNSNKQDYLKNPGGFRVFLKCYSENGIQNITIKENLISTKHGMYKTDINLYAMFLIKPSED